MNSEQLMHFSKRISYALRHDPERFGLTLADDGSVPVDDLITGLNRNSRYHCTRKGDKTI